MPRIARLVPGRTVFLLCDVQERFRSAIYGYDEIVLTINKILKVAKLLNIPVIVTEQNPKALGSTAHEIDLASLGDLHLGTVPKLSFSMMPAVKELLRDHHNIESVVLFGIESHVCVLQTALDLLEQNYDVHVLADGVSSCNREEVPIALARIQQAGGYITTSESAAFQLQQTAESPQFKPLSQIIKEEKDNTVKAVQKLVQFRSAL
ncbi:Isochorismatase-like protein [Scleroderma yunnanense]